MPVRVGRQAQFREWRATAAFASTLASRSSIRSTLKVGDAQRWDTNGGADGPGE
jgi:hypothetical protein